MRAQARIRSAWRWIPTLYFAQAVPFVVVMTVSVVMYKTLGISNSDIALYTSWLYLPWVIKPFWSPLVDMFATKRIWILAMQLAIGASLAMVALTLPMPHFFRMSLAVLWLVAFASATHDIAADGFYMLATTERQQALFVGVISVIPGLPAGLAIAWLMNLSTPALTGHFVAFHWRWGFTLGCAGAALVVALLAALLPARRAAQLRVIEALQYE